MNAIHTVTVIGATGTMGANVAGIFAAFGDAKVYCIGRDMEKVKRTIPRIIKSVKADSIRENLIPADFSMIEQCISESDLVFESLIEDISVKTDIAQIIAKYLTMNAIACTGSSGLSIKRIAECYPEEKRRHFFGVHMFNPPYNMSLCELISTDYSDEQTKKELKSYLHGKLFRTVVDVNDSPAFLANRIGFQFINEALLFADRYKDNGGIDYIDAILGPFTGRSMAPLLTSDFVGLDVYQAIVDNLYKNTNDYAHETFVLPEFVQNLIKNNWLGRKTGRGLYQTIKHGNDKTSIMVYDIAKARYRNTIPYIFPFAERMKKCFRNGDYQEAFCELINNHSLEADLCLSFLLKYIIYSLYAEKEIGCFSGAADDVMATGFNWCPPYALFYALSETVDVSLLIKERLPEISAKTDITNLLANLKRSNYDYRPFFKSGIQ